jgi:hypothetical protein
MRPPSSAENAGREREQRRTRRIDARKKEEQPRFEAADCDEKKPDNFTKHAPQR